MSNPLKDKLGLSDLVTLMSAHNPLSARLAEEAGFDGIWASGFELSAAYGVPDASLLSLTQHLDMTRAITERVSVPVIADLDTGYGNAVNVMHVVGAYARAGVAGGPRCVRRARLVGGRRSRARRGSEASSRVRRSRSLYGPRPLQAKSTRRNRRLRAAMA